MFFSLQRLTDPCLQIFFLLYWAPLAYPSALQQPLAFSVVVAKRLILKGWKLI